MFLEGGKRGKEFREREKGGKVFSGNEEKDILFGKEREGKGRTDSYRTIKNGKRRKNLLIRKECEGAGWGRKEEKEERKGK